MGVLDTFYILFKTDADEAAASIQKVDDAADAAEASLEAAAEASKKVADNTKGLGLGMKGASVGANETAAAVGKVAAGTAVADVNAKRLSTSFLSMARALAAPAIALFSFSGLSKIATERAAVIRELDLVSNKLNSSISDVDAFQRSLQELGGSGAAGLDALTKIGEKVNEAFSDAKSGARKDFQQWGVAFKDAQGHALGATDAMLNLAGSLERVSKAEALARIKRLGIQDAATIELLLKGRRAVEEHMEAQKRQGVVTEELAQTTREYYKEVGRFGGQMTWAGNRITSLFLPAVTEGLRALNRLLDWMARNQKLVEGFFVGVAAAVTTYFLPAMLRAAVAVIAVTWPFLALGAAIAAVGAAFALVYEDISAWVNGQPSLIGELLGPWEEFRDQIKAVFAVFDPLFKTFDEAWRKMKSDMSGMGSEISAMWDNLGQKFGEIGDDLANVWNDGKASFDEFASWLGGKMQSLLDTVRPVIDGFREAFDVVVGAIRAYWEGLFGYIRAGLDAILGGIRSLGQAIGLFKAPPAPGAAPSGDGGGPSMPFQNPGTPAPTGPDGWKPSTPAPTGPPGWGGQKQSSLPFAQEAIKTAQNAPAGLATGGGVHETTVNRETNVQVSAVNVHTQAVDAQGMAKAAAGALQDQLRTAAADFDTGVAA